MSEPAPDVIQAGDSDWLAQVDFPSIARVGLCSVLSLWRDGTFLRASTDDPSQLRPTATFRCAEVLLGAKASAPEVFDAEACKVLDAAARVVTDTDLDDALRLSELNYPLFTMVLLALATAQVARSKLDDAARAQARVSGLVERIAEELRAAQLLRVHPFIQEHAIRALVAAQPHLTTTVARKAQRLKERLVKSTARHAELLIAKHHMALITPGESVALAFCGATLSTRSTMREGRIALAALDAAAAAQDASGSWPLGRVVLTEPGRLEISTYEVAWVVAVALSTLLPRISAENSGAAARIAGSITRAGSFADRSLVALNGQRGWASDHPYQEPRIESWTSAIALQFALAGEDLRRDLQNQEILRTFTSISPEDERWPGWLRWPKLSKGAEPESEWPIYPYLEEQVIGPIRAHPKQLPSGKNECTSVLLFGPPGTSKTTIVQAVADALSWPVVFLSPGTFIEHGLEAIEASAQSVFSRLQALRRVVVIFDECDELFRDRSPSGISEPIRSISAFVTASMLPRLQELHDRGEVLFFICTNHFRMMDAAVKRGGRIDHRIGVGPPDTRARAAILKDLDPVPAARHLNDALDELARATERFSRSELMRAGEKLIKTQPWRSKKAARDAASRVAQTMEPSLTITTGLLTAYKEDRSTYSDPYLERV